MEAMNRSLGAGAAAERRQVMHEIEARRAIAMSSKTCSGIGELALQLTQHLQEVSADCSLRLGVDSLSHSKLQRDVMMRLHEDSGGAAAGLAACPELVRALFRSSVELQDTTALMILRKICSWETACDKFSLGGFSGDEQVQLLRLARDECSSAINRATVCVAQQGGEEHKRA